MELLFSFINKMLTRFYNFWKKFEESVFITKRQYRLRFLGSTTAANKKVIAIVQVAIKRVKIKLSIQYLASNKNLLKDIHPISVCKITFIANIANEVQLAQIPSYIIEPNISGPIIKEKPTLKIKSRSFSPDKSATSFVIAPIANSSETITLSAQELAKNHALLYGLGSEASAAIGIAASSDYLNEIRSEVEAENTKANSQPQKFLYYHILCVSYISLILSGISIVRRLFPFHIPFTDLTVPFGASVLFFPLTFSIQDVTTEVYGFSHARHMVQLAVLMIFFYIFYTQIAIHLPSGTESIYANNQSFEVVFNTIPKQFVALIVSLLTGMLINDFFISKSKIIFGGQYLWARVLGSTMVGEAVLQVVGGIIGFSDTMNFYTQLLPNMMMAYGYKMLWNAATIPFIYMLSSYLKRKEGVDVFDYDVNYNPFKLSIS